MHFDSLKASDGEKFEFLKTKIADSQYLHMTSVSILNATQ